MWHRTRSRPAAKPAQNAYIEHVNKTYRTEVLDCDAFTNLGEGNRVTEDWRRRSNQRRPHRAFGGLTPVPFAMAQSRAEPTICWYGRRGADQVELTK